MTRKLATRGSPLALWQAYRAQEALARVAPDEAFDILEVQSSGDVDLTSQLARFGKIGIFTAEVDQAVVEGRADIGVHSMKDLTTTLADGVVLAAALPRGPVEDVLVTRDAPSLAELPRGARVATGSMRRAAMLLRERPDLDIGPLRGNVQTRLSKLDAGEADAIVLARAGLERLELVERVREVLSTERFVPAVGQGIVGLTCRADHDELREVLARLSDPQAWAAAQAERRLLADLQGGCSAPVGGHARIEGDELTMHAIVLATDGSEVIEGHASGPASDPATLGASLAAELRSRGAARLVQAAR